MMVIIQSSRFPLLGIILFLVFLFLPFNSALAQNNDCAEAEVICDGSNIDYTPSGPGSNDFADPDNNSGCLVSQENQSAWYYFEFSLSMPPNSTIEFDIQPYGGAGEDYDFAVFGPNVDCGNLGGPIRCSYASSNCAFCPNTGVGNGTSDQTEGPNGDGYVSAITVQPGEGYYLLVDNYNNSSNGFSLAWGGTGSNYLDCFAEPPCAGLNVTVSPNTFAFCENEAPFNLDVIVSGGPAGMEYLWSGTYASNLSDVNILNPILTPPSGFTGDMTFDLTITEGNCLEVYPISVTINPIPTAEAGNPQIIDCNNPSVTLSSTGSTTGPNIVLTWSLNGQPVGSGSSVNVSEEGLYTLTVTNSVSGCSATDDVLITDNSIPPVASGDAFGEITCYTPEVVMGVLDQSNPNATYEWYDGQTLIGDGTEIIVNTPGTFTLVVTDQSNGCTASTFITVVENTVPPFANPESTNNIDCINPISAIIATNAFPFDADFVWYFNGDYFDAGQFITAYEPGVYTMLMTDLYNGCLYEDTVIVSETPSSVISAPDLPNLLTCNQSTVTLNTGNSSTGTGISYSWQNEAGAEISTDNSVVVFEAGQYTLVVIDNNSGCTADSTFFVNQDINPPNITIQASDSLTCVNDTVSLSGTTQPDNMVSFLWTDDDGNELGDAIQISVTNPGTYYLNVTNLENGCQNSAPVEVIQNTLSPNADAGPNDTLTCEYQSVTLNGNNSSGLDPLLYSWSLNGQQVGNNVLLLVDSQGTYTLTVTNAGNGCTDSDKVIVLQNTSQPVAEAGTDTTLTCYTPQITLVGNAAGGNQLTSQWSDQQGTILSDSLSAFADNPGTYFFTVTNALNGCISIDSVSLNQNILTPFINAGADTTLTCSTTEILLQGTASSNNGPFSFEWTDNANNILSDSSSLLTQIPGSYNFTVTDLDNGCQSTDEVSVAQDIQNPSADAGPNGILTCLTGTVSLTGDNSSTGSDFNYDWIDENGNYVGNEINIEVSDPGTFTLTVTNLSNGCSSSDTVLVTPDSETPVAKISGSDVLNCFADTILLSGNNSTQGSSMTVTWLNEIGNILGNDVEIMVFIPQTYYLIVENSSNGCADTASLQILEDFSTPSTIIDYSPSNVISCFQQEVEVNSSLSSGNAPLDFQWLTENGDLLAENDSLLIQTPGNYSLLVTNTGNGCTSTSDFSIVDNTTPPIADAGTDGILTCADAFFSLDGSNSSSGVDFSYSWLNSNGDVIASTAQTSVIVAGTYILSVVNNQNGCVDSDTIIVTPDSNLPAANGSASDILTCTISQVNLSNTGSATGPDITYTWLDPTGTPLSSDPAITASSPGSYTLIVTNNANGCSSTAFIPVQQDTTNPVASSLITKDTITCFQPEIILAGLASAANGAPQVSWIDQQSNLLSNSDSAFVQIAGAYYFVVNDQTNGCSDTAVVSIFGNNQSPDLNAGNDTVLTCANKTIIVHAIQPDTTVPFAYQWKNDLLQIVSNSLQVSITQPGSYTLTATNLDNGCQSQDEITVSQNITSPVADAGIPATLNCELSTYILGSSNTSVGPEFTYEWIDSDDNLISNNDTAIISNPDNYVLIVTNNNNGCTATDQVAIDQNIALPTANAGPNKTLTCVDTAFQLGFADAGNNSNLTFAWTNNTGQLLNTNPVIVINYPGVFTLSVTDTTNGCTQSDNVTVLANNLLPAAVAASNGILSCTKTSVSLNGGGSTAASGGALQFSWSDPVGNPIGSSSAALAFDPGNYLLKVTDPTNGCIDTDTITVVQNIEAPVANAGTNNILTCFFPELTLDASNSTGNQLQFSWLSSNALPLGSNPQLLVNNPDNYTLVVTDGINGCKDTSVVQITQNTTQPAAAASNAGNIDCFSPVSTLEGAGSSFGPNFTYAWTNQNGDTLSNNLNTSINQAGIFSLLVTDLTNGCTNIASTSIAIDTTSPNAIVGQPEMLTCDNTSAILDGSNSTGASNLIFEWLDEANNSLSILNSVEVTTPGAYQLIVTNENNGCTDTAELVLLQDISIPQPVIDANFTQITCTNPNISLNGANSQPLGQLQFNWTQNNNPLSISSQISVSQPGNYSLLVTNTTNGCFASTNITITENTTIPSVLINTPNIITCLDQTATLDGSASSSGTIFDYSWSGPSIVSGAQSAIAQADAAGTYILTVLNTDNGCQNNASTTVIADQEYPTAMAQALDVVDCFNSEARLSGIGSSEGPDISYLWTTGTGLILSGENSLIPIAGSGGIYQLLVTNTANGCTAVADAEVIANTTPPENAVATLSNPSCYGFENGGIAIQEVIGGTPPYLYSLNGYPFSAGLPNYENLPAGDYLITVQDVNGCEWSEVFTLNQPDSLTATLGEEWYIELGESINLNLIVNRTDEQLEWINWTTPEGKFCRDIITLDCKTVTDTPYINTLYAVQIADTNGCKATAEVLVRVNQLRPIFIPNAFSPDGDGRNDKLIVFGGPNVNIIKNFAIFDRWGETLFSQQNFQPNDTDFGWSGEFKGNQMDPGVYVYYAEVEFIDGQIIVYKGDFTLVR